MTITLEEFLQREFTEEEREEIEAGAYRLFAEELSLRGLRHACNQTQQGLAQSMNCGQEGVSRLEKRNDLLLSTLRRYVEGLGGRLRLVAEFPDRPPVLIRDLPEADGADNGMERGAPDKPRAG